MHLQSKATSRIQRQTRQASHKTELPQIECGLGPDPKIRLPILDRKLPRQQPHRIELSCSRLTMSLPNIPLHWILEYAVSEPTEFTDAFILGLSIRLIPNV
jgi:hypothetical protein